MRSFGPEKNSQHAFYCGAIFLSSVWRITSTCAVGRCLCGYLNLLIDYKFKVHLIINTASMLEFKLRKHKKSGIEITWRDLILEAEVFDRSAELFIVTGSNLDPKKYWYVHRRPKLQL